MMLKDALGGIGSDLRAQLSLALASPLWRELPFGLEVNPHSWGVEVLENRAGHRLSLKLSIPWRSAPRAPAPLELILRLWHPLCAVALHQQLSRFHQLVRELENRQPLPEPVFYDALAHTLVYPYRSLNLGSTEFQACLQDCWMAQCVSRLTPLAA